LIIREGPTADHLSAVEAGAIDVALVRGPIDSATLRVTTLRREKVILAMPIDHPLASCSAVPWTALARFDCVMFPRTGSAPLYDAIIAQCVNANVSLRIVHEAGEWSTVSALVAAGAGLGFAPESASRFHVEGITFRPLKGGTAIAEIAAVFRQENMSPVLPVFVAIASNVT
jgi:DNA-binding transcriptional LysR family regulator